MRDTTRMAARLVLCTVALVGFLAGARLVPDRPAAAPAAATPAEVPWGTIAARLSVGN